MDLLSLSPRERCCRLHRLHYSIQQTRNRGVDDAEADAVHLFVRCVSRTDNKRTPGIAASLETLLFELVGGVSGYGGCDDGVDGDDRSWLGWVWQP